MENKKLLNTYKIIFVYENAGYFTYTEAANYEQVVFRLHEIYLQAEKSKVSGTGDLKSIVITVKSELGD